VELGVTIPHTGRLASPAFVREFSVTADRLGFGALWSVDHVVMPHHTDSLYTLGRNPASIADDAVSGLLSPNYEMMTTLAFVAGFTERIKIGTCVSVLPIRNALMNARQLASLDVYSGGRVLYGAGVGWLQEEAAAMNMPWDHRGRRSEEHIELLRTMWCAEGDLVEFEGEFHQVPPMDPEPRPVQRPIPILIGGHSDTALERAGRIGDGWIAARMSPERVRVHWAKVRRGGERRILAAALRRPPARDVDPVALPQCGVGVDYLTSTWAPAMATLMPCTCCHDVLPQLDGRDRRDRCTGWQAGVAIGRPPYWGWPGNAGLPRPAAQAFGLGFRSGYGDISGDVEAYPEAGWTTTVVGALPAPLVGAVARGHPPHSSRRRRQRTGCRCVAGGLPGGVRPHPSRRA
jgi:probable F420-dependent oxidoreductase